MSVFDIFIIGVGLSMDAFAVAATDGIVSKPNLKKALLIAFAFGLFQAAMPLIGFFAGSLFGEIVEKYDHWIALVLLTIIGGKMIADFFEKDEEKTTHSLTLKTLLMQAVATSIDALAVGVSFAGLTFNVFVAVGIIGITTFALSLIAIYLGETCGKFLADKATLVGGIILVAIGLKIFIEGII